MTTSNTPNPPNQSPDTSRLSFAVESRPVKYGDNKTFYEYRILLRDAGEVVGIEDGPRRIHRDRSSARRAGYDRIRVLKTEPLYIIRVTAADIDHGEARSCETCAIAQALWRNQERMGFKRYDFNFRVIPYAAFTEVDGICLWGPNTELITGESNMPDVVMKSKRATKGFWEESMYEWAINFDEWAERRYMTKKEWEEEHGEDNEPYKPSPCSFVLNLASLKPEHVIRGAK